MVQRFGLTWWGRRWIGALEQLGATWENRLPRGRTYARKGTVHDLVIAAGRVTARVDGSRPDPYEVVLELDTFDDATWAAIVDALAAQVRHAAALLDHRMPEDVDETLSEVGVSLFPSIRGRHRDLRTACSCPDWANPCKHVAAVHYVLATRFDDDPFLLMGLRGRGRVELLAELRARRAGEVAAAEVPADEVQSLSLDAVTPDMLFDAPSAAGVDVVEIDPARVDVVAVLHRLGPLPGPLRHAQADVEHAVERAAAAAWDLLRGVDDGEAARGQHGEQAGRPTAATPGSGP